MGLDGKDWQNLGDYYQSYAMRLILEELDLGQQIEEISKYELSTYDGEYIFLLMNCYDSLTNQLRLVKSSYPISEKIIPCYVSYHLQSELSSDVAAYLKKYEPIGCRDEFTMNNMRRKGIKAYLTGCVTALLPRTALVPSIKEGGKIIFVDTPDSLEPFIPKEWKGNIEYYSAKYSIVRTDGSASLSPSECKTVSTYAMKQLEYYRTQAAIIVTSRLHVASPCMAMGIPVILTCDNIDCRYTWIDKLLPVYSRENFKDIDWHPAPVEYEKEKQFLKEKLGIIIKKAWEQAKDIYAVSEFWENREKVPIHMTLYRYIANVPMQHNQEIKYIIWGVPSPAAEIKQAIDMYFPNWKMSHVIDLNCEGYFEGRTIEKPEIVDYIKDDDIYIIVPESAYEPVGKLLREKNKRYILINTKQCQWSDNISEI